MTMWRSPGADCAQHAVPGDCHPAPDGIAYPKNRLKYGSFAIFGAIGPRAFSAPVGEAVLITMRRHVGVRRKAGFYAGSLWRPAGLFSLDFRFLTPPRLRSPSARSSFVPEDDEPHRLGGRNSGRASINR
jgi:hypothetical protein